jgi:hypothetical protein
VIAVTGGRGEILAPLPFQNLREWAGRCGVVSTFRFISASSADAPRCEQPLEVAKTWKRKRGSDENGHVIKKARWESP